MTAKRKTPRKRVPKKKTPIWFIFVPTIVTLLILLVGWIWLNYGPSKSKEAGGNLLPREVAWNDKSTSEWCELLRHNNPLVRQKARDALTRYGVKAVKPLMVVLADQNADEARAEAALTLAQIGPDAQAAEPVLARSLMDAGWPQRDTAAIALGKLGSLQPTSIERLATCLKSDTDVVVRCAAAEALGQGTNASEKTVQALSTVLDQDADPMVMAAAAEALGRIGPAAKPALVSLREAASSEDWMLSQAAKTAITKIEGP